MSEWIRTVRGALLFDTATFAHFHTQHDAVMQGFILIVVVALLAWFPSFMVSLGDGLRPQPPAAEASDATAAFERSLAQMAPFMQGLPADTRDQILSQIRQGTQIGLEIAVQIQSLPTILPRPVGRGLQALGEWLSQPFGRSGMPLAAATLATWLGYGIWVMLAAKLLGGRSDLAGFFGTTSLFAVPHLLDVLRLVPVLGAIVAVIATLWGLGIYVKATAVSHEISIGRAVVALILPVLALIVIGLVALIVAIIVIAIAASGH